MKKYLIKWGILNILSIIAITLTFVFYDWKLFLILFFWFFAINISNEIYKKK